MSHTVAVVVIIVLVVIVLVGVALLGWGMYEYSKEEVFLLYLPEQETLKVNGTQSDLVSKYKDIVKKAGYKPVTLSDLRKAAGDGAAWCGLGFLLDDSGRNLLLTTGFPNGKGKFSKETCPAVDVQSGSNWAYVDEVVYDKTDKVSPDTVSWGVLVKGKKPDITKVTAMPWSSDLNPNQWWNLSADERQALLKDKKYQWSSK